MSITLTAGKLRFVRQASAYPGPMSSFALDLGQRLDHSALAALILKCRLLFLKISVQRGAGKPPLTSSRLRRHSLQQFQSFLRRPLKHLHLFPEPTRPSTFSRQVVSQPVQRFLLLG